MIQYNNHNNIKEIHYNNHSIKYVYGCGGNLVWSGDTPTPTGGTKFYATYNDSSTYSVDCDGDSRLLTGSTHYGGYSKYSGMTSAVIGDCVTSIGDGNYGPFGNCVSLTAVTIPNSVTNIRSAAFRYCNSLTSVGIPGSGASVEIPTGVTSFSDGSEFDYCSGLTDVVIGDQITSLSYGMFSNCFSLTSVTIGSGVSNMDAYVFKNCTALTSVTINAVTPPTSDATPSNWGAFENTNDCPIYVPAESVAAYKTANLWGTYASRIQAIP